MFVCVAVALSVTSSALKRLTKLLVGEVERVLLLIRALGAVDARISVLMAVWHVVDTDSAL